MSLNIVLMVVAIACFAVEAIRSRNVVAGGLALWALAVLLRG